VTNRNFKDKCVPDTDLVDPFRTPLPGDACHKDDKNLPGLALNTATTCFLAGTLIAVDGTGASPRPVESLRPGDVVLTATPGGMAPRALTWVGRRSVVARRRDDCPVRVLRGAIDEGVPFQDLLVTQDHCLLLDGQFVPVRLLVNNRSILIDESFVQFDVFHVETDGHSVIFANGAMTESFLDIGTKSLFTAMPNLRLVSDTQSLPRAQAGGRGSGAD